MPQKPPVFANWISTGNILTILSTAVGGLWFLSTMNTALAVQSEKSAHNAAEIARVSSENRERWNRVEDSMNEMRSDIKKLLERQREDRR